MIKDQWFQFTKRDQTPFPNYLSMESSTKEMKKAVGFKYKKLKAIISGNDFYFYFLKNDYNNIAEKIFKEIEKNPDFFKILINRQKKFGEEFVRNTKKNSNYKLKQISNKKLVDFSRQYEKEYKKIYSNYFAVLGVEDYLLSYLTNYLFKEFKNKKIALKYFNKLTTEPDAMVTMLEKRDLLKITLSITENKKWLKIFKSLNVEEEIKKEKKLYRKIKNHEKKWFWITRGYEGQVLTFDNFINKIRENISLNVSDQLQLIKQKNEQLRAEQKKIKIKKEMKDLFEAVRDSIRLKEIRKKNVSQSLHYFDPILREIARRGGLSVYQSKFLRIFEIEDMLMNDKNFSDIINERIKLSVYLISNGTTKIIVGEKAKEEYNKYCKIPQNLKEIKGFAASSGKVVGRVKKVLNISEIDKIKKGDIVVTVNAESDFSTAIIMASGLITDGGTGVTSHPATLAREVGIPCVIDTKIATKVLKDGDLIEVDGDNGIIKIKKNN